MKGERHRLNFLQKKLRSLIKRGLISLVNASDSYVVQHLPEWIDRKNFNFKIFRKLWTLQSPQNDQEDLVRLCMLIENIQQLQKDHVQGSVAELGVYKGTTAKILHTLMPERPLYLFDTFEGFDKQDFDHEQSKTSSSISFEDTSIENVKAFLGPSSLINYCKGHFPTTAVHIPKEERFALVHLDADLYKPTLDALTLFYPRVSPGGIMLIHDYSSLAWPGIAQAVDQFFQDKPESIMLLPDKSGTAMIRKIK